MKTLEFNISNIVENDGIAVSITGMTIVFGGLALVSLFIFGLPKFLRWLDRIRGNDREEEKAKAILDNTKEIHDAEVAVAIAMVLQHAMTQEDGSAYQRLTIRRTPEDSKWKQASMLHTLSTHVPMRKVQR